MHQWIFCSENSCFIHIELNSMKSISQRIFVGVIKKITIGIPDNVNITASIIPKLNRLWYCKHGNSSIDCFTYETMNVQEDYFRNHMSHSHANELKRKKNASFFPRSVAGLRVILLLLGKVYNIIVNEANGNHQYNHYSTILISFY